MKLKLFKFTFLITIVLLFVSCDSQKEEEIEKNKEPIVKEEIIQENIKKIDTIIVDSVSKKNKKEVTEKVFKFICPQGDVEGNSDKKGICPSCGMELIENPDFK